jgi:cytochrome c oxidase accessory protein FixG
MLFDFCFFREQMCTIACPYGRFQSVLLDRDSLIVGYDERRGEPRGKLRKGDDAGARGDCIDCTMCVQVCPTGIDIRQGLQMECIHCTQCVDACDSIMDKIGKPQGLIRYSSQNRLERVAGKRFRFRLAVYPLLLGALLTGFVYTLVTRQDAMVVQLQAQGTPYTVQEDGTVLNTVRLRVDNRTREPRTYAIEAGQGTTLREAVPPFTVDPTTSAEVAVHVLSPHASFAGGRRDITLRVLDGKTYDVTHSFPIIGPLGSFTRSAD